MEIGEYYLHNYNDLRWDSKTNGDIWVLVDTEGPHPCLKVVSPIKTYCSEYYRDKTASLEEDYLEKI